MLDVQTATAGELPLGANQGFTIVDGEDLVGFWWWNDSPQEITPPPVPPAVPPPDEEFPVPPPPDPVPHTEFHTTYAAVRGSLPTRLASLGYADEVDAIEEALDELYGPIARDKRESFA